MGLPVGLLAPRRSRRRTCTARTWRAACRPCPSAGSCRSWRRRAAPPPPARCRRRGRDVVEDVVGRAVRGRGHERLEPRAAGEVVVRDAIAQVRRGEGRLVFLRHRDDAAEVAEPHRARRLRARVREEPGRGRLPDVVLGEVEHGLAEVARRRGRVARAPRAKREAERRHRETARGGTRPREFPGPGPRGSSACRRRGGRPRPRTSGRVEATVLSRIASAWTTARSRKSVRRPRRCSSARISAARRRASRSPEITLWPPPSRRRCARSATARARSTRTKDRSSASHVLLGHEHGRGLRPRTARTPRTARRRAGGCPRGAP